jgi:hypothetical protein
VNDTENHWQVYRSKFLVRAKRLTGPLAFVDTLGRDHRGQKGDYLMEWSSGVLRIVPREFFETAYVPLESGVNASAADAFDLEIRPAKKRSQPVRKPAAARSQCLALS